MIRIALLVLSLSLIGLPGLQGVAEGQDSGGKPAAKSRNKAAPNKKGPAKPKRMKGSGMRGKATKSAPAARHAAADKAPAQSTEKAPSTPEPAAPAGRAPNVGDAAALSADADERVRKEGDSEVKTVEFGGLDIEGQLKTPQMLYFLNRLRAEFSRPELPHRSFIPELQRGTKENAF